MAFSFFLCYINCIYSHFSGGLKMKRNFGLKLLCMVIALALIAVCIPFGALAATESEIKLGLLSDVHYLAEENMGPDRDLFDQVCRLSNYESNLSDSFMDCAFATLKAEQAAGNLDYVLISGDLTRNGEYTGHVALANRLKQFEAETGIQVLVIDGNHDINNGNAEKFDGTRALPDDPCTPEQFREIYADLGYDLADAFYAPPAGSSLWRHDLSAVGDIHDLLHRDGISAKAARISPESTRRFSSPRPRRPPTKSIR